MDQRRNYILKMLKTKTGNKINASYSRLVRSYFVKTKTLVTCLHFFKFSVYLIRRSLGKKRYHNIYDQSDDKCG